MIFEGKIGEHMVQWHRKSKRKKTGGFLRSHRKKKPSERGRDFLPTEINEKKVKTVRVRGGNRKLIALSTDIANITVGGKTQKAKILEVVENPADSHFVRRNIITKGAIIETESGRAVVTNRPGQDGTVNAKLVEEKK